MERHFQRTGWIVACSAFALGCSADSEVPLAREEAEKNPEKVVIAHVGNERYTLADLTASIAQRGALAQERYQASQAKRAFLDSFIDFEVLAREGLARGHLQAPVVARAYKSALAATLWEKGALPGAERGLLTEERLRSYFEGHRSEFMEADTARAAHVLIKAPEGAPLQSRHAALVKARKLLAELGERADVARFADFARRFSDDDATKQKGGDLGVVVRGSDEGDVAGELVDAVFDTPVGTVRTVASSSGVHLLRVDARFPGKPAPFESVRKKVEARVWQELRREGMKRLLATLRAQVSVEKVAAARLAPLPEKPRRDGGAMSMDAAGPVMTP